MFPKVLNLFRFRFANIFQSLDGKDSIFSPNLRLFFLLSFTVEFSESVFGFPRPGEDRSYMRPLIESSAMMQPNLEPLNPTLDDFLERLEPMEGNSLCTYTTNGKDFVL